MGNNTENRSENLKNHIKIAQLYRFFPIAAQKSCFELYVKLVQEAYLFNLFLLKIVKLRRVKQNRKKCAYRPQKTGKISKHTERQGKKKRGNDLLK